MAYNKIYKTLTIGVGGSTTAFSVEDGIQEYNILASGGAVVLVGNIAISSSGTPTTQTTFNFRFGGGFTLGANTCTFFGVALTAAQCLYEQYITAIYNGSGWDVSITSDFSNGRVDINGADIVAGSIVNASIASGTIGITKNAVLAARGYLPRGGAGGVWEGFNAVTSGQLVMGNGTDITSVAMSGDISITGTGVTAIGAGKVTAAMLAFTIVDQLEATLTIPTASVLTLNATPLTLVAAPGAGKYIEVISASACMTFVSAAYAANTTLLLQCEGATIHQMQDTSILLSTVTKNTRFVQSSSAVAAGETQIIVNTPLQVKVSGGNPTTGDSNLKIKVNYRIVTL